MGQLGSRDQGQFHDDMGQAGIAQIALSAKQQVQHPRKVHDFVGCRAPPGFSLQAEPEGLHQFAPEAGPIGAHGIQGLALVQDLAAIALKKGIQDSLHAHGRDNAQLLTNHIFNHAAIASGDDAIENGEGIAHGALASFGEQAQSTLITADAFTFADELQAGFDETGRNEAEGIDLNPALDRVGHILEFRGGQYEDRVSRGFFEDLQQCIEGAAAEHVHFVDDVDTVAAKGGAGLDLLSQGAGVFHAGAGGGVNFDDVQVAIRLLRGHAGIADTTGRCRGTFLAVQGAGQDSGRGGLACAANTGEEEGLMVDRAGGLGAGKRIIERPDTGFLPHEIREQTGTVLECKRGHGNPSVP